jgi:lipid-binding SYLF domain-containing protein
VEAAIQLMKQTDPTLDKFFKSSEGYAVFPNVGKGAIGIGGAHGKGEVYEKGILIGRASLSQLTIGFQLGGQVYSEIIFFETKDTLQDFKEGAYKVSAQASAVAAADGVGANAKYEHGVVIFTLAKNGLMFEASVGGQKFKFIPLE